MPTEPHDSPPPSQSARGPHRWLLLGIGVLFTGVAILGAFLPVLPTTPFLLLAMAAFARSSPTLQRRLLNAPIFGVYLRQWNEDRSIPRQAKWKAYGLIVVTMGFSIQWVQSDGLRILLGVIAIALLIFMRSLQTSEQMAGADGNPAKSDAEPGTADVKPPTGDGDRDQN